MAEMRFEFESCAKPTVEFSGTVDELIEFARKYSDDKPAEIEGPVRVGDTIEITKAATNAIKRGKRYKVARIDDEGYPRIDGYGLSDFGLAISEYRIVARKEEALKPAKPSVKVGDYVVSTGDTFGYTTFGKAYEVVGIDGDGEPLIEDDDGDEIGLDPHEYRIITDARELAFAKAGRKLNEFKTGDIVGSGGRLRIVDEVDPERLTLVGEEQKDRKRCHLVAPAEARVDTND